jgi:hypothetical protein
LISGIPARLSPGGTGQLPANWIIDVAEPWQERLTSWLAGTGCDAWAWQRELAEPGEYAALWLRDAGERPGTDSWRRRYHHWLDWFADAGVAAIGMGLVSLRRTGSDRPVVVCEDLPQPVEQPVGRQIDGWFDRLSWLRDHDDQQLLASRLTPADGLVHTRLSMLDDRDDWQPALIQLRQSHGLRWEIEVDDAVSALVAACTRPLPLLPVRDLIQRGFLLPTGSAG